MLQERTEMGQRQPADPARSFPAADPDERPGGLPGVCVFSFLLTVLNSGIVCAPVLFVFAL